MRAPVSFCLIVRNEESQLEACLQSIRPHVEEIVVVDTGSTDGTVALARRLADRVEIFTTASDAEGRLLDFARARNHAFSLANQPWISWIDADDVLVGGERLPELVASWDHYRKGQPALVRHRYDYAFDASGRCICAINRERFITRGGPFRWRYPVHEIIEVVAGSPVLQLECEELLTQHRPHPDRPRDPRRNLRILLHHEATCDEADRPRLLFALAREYADLGAREEAIRCYEQYLPVSRIEEERGVALVSLSEHCCALRRFQEALEWGARAFALLESWDEPLFAMGRAAACLAQTSGRARDWQRAVNLIQLGLAMPTGTGPLFIDGTARIEIHRILSHALHQLGQHALALRSIEFLLAHRPEDESLRRTRDRYRQLAASQG